MYSQIDLHESVRRRKLVDKKETTQELVSSDDVKFGLGFLVFVLCLAVLDVMTNGVNCS